MKRDPRNVPGVPSLTAELVHEYKAILGESPLWEARERLLYWMDIGRGHIHRFDPATRENATHTLDTKVTSIGWRARGGGSALHGMIRVEAFRAPSVLGG
jgi:sugar lactone lactonase YvrE